MSSVAAVKLITPEDDNDKTTDCVCHVVCRLLKIIRREVVIVLALPYDLRGVVLVAHHGPEPARSPVGGNPIANYCPFPRANLWLHIRPRPEKPQLYHFSDYLLKPRDRPPSVLK